MASDSIRFYRADVAALDFNDTVQLNFQKNLLVEATEPLLRVRIESNKSLIMA